MKSRVFKIGDSVAETVAAIAPVPGTGSPVDFGV